MSNAPQEPTTDTTPTDSTDELVEPTEDERKNGWTAETLTRYLVEADKRASAHMDPLRPRRRPDMQNSSYNPLRWRRD